MKLENLFERLDRQEILKAWSDGSITDIIITNDNDEDITDIEASGFVCFDTKGNSYVAKHVYGEYIRIESLVDKSFLIEFHMGENGGWSLASTSLKDVSKAVHHNLARSISILLPAN